MASGSALANGAAGSPRSKHPSAWNAMQKEHQAAMSKAVSDAQVEHLCLMFVSSAPDRVHDGMQHNADKHTSKGTCDG